MDFRSISKFDGYSFPMSSTVVTPQLEDYAMFHSFRALPTIVYPGKRQPFMLALNLANVLQKDLKIARVNETDSNGQDVLQVQVEHPMKEMHEDSFSFSRECTYRYSLPNHLHDKPLAALWTVDNYLIMVESSNIVDSVKLTDVDETSVKKGCTTFIVPQKVNGMYRPTVSVDVLRKSVELAQRDLQRALKQIQHGSFVCPDGIRLEDEIVEEAPDPSEEEEDEDEVEMEEASEPTKEDEPYLKKEFVKDCIDHLEHLFKILEAQTKGSGSIEDEIARRFTETNEEMTKKIEDTVRKIEKRVAESDKKVK